MGVQIDESRYDVLPARIDHFFGLMGFQIAELGDLAILDTDVSAIARHTGAIDHGAPANDYIEFSHDKSLLPVPMPALNRIKKKNKRSTPLICPNRIAYSAFPSVLPSHRKSFLKESFRGCAKAEVTAPRAAIAAPECKLRPFRFAS